jgi:hypothetical protein
MKYFRFSCRVYDSLLVVTSTVRKQKGTRKQRKAHNQRRMQYIRKHYKKALHAFARDLYEEEYGHAWPQRWPTDPAEQVP